MAVPENEIDWYRDYCLSRAMNGVVMGAFTTVAEAQDWGLDRERVIAAQRLWWRTTDGGKARFYAFIKERTAALGNRA